MLAFYFIGMMGWWIFWGALFGYNLSILIINYIYGCKILGYVYWFSRFDKKGEERTNYNNPEQATPFCLIFGAMSGFVWLFVVCWMLIESAKTNREKGARIEA